MSTRVKLSSIIEGMEFQSADYPAYLNRTTGEVIPMTDDLVSSAEDREPVEDHPEWQHDDLRAAREILNDDPKYIALPGQFDIDEFRMMEDFASDVEDETVRGALFSALGGRGSFRRFKDRCMDHGVEKRWYAYRDAQYKALAEEWCRDNDVPYVDDLSSTEKPDGTT